MATPHVTGALTLLLTRESALDMSSAIERLYLAGRELSTLTGVVSTGRVLDVGRMLGGNTSDLPTTKPQCEYSLTEVNNEIDSAADSSEVLLRADEYNYTRVDLPFSFPFFSDRY